MYYIRARSHESREWMSSQDKISFGLHKRFHPEMPGRNHLARNDFIPHQRWNFWRAHSPNTVPQWIWQKKKKTNNLISVNCVFLFLCSGFYLVLHVIHAAENKISVFIADEGRHMPSFLAFILVIKKLSCKRARSRFVIFSR